MKISPLMFLPPLLFLGFVALSFFGLFRETPGELPSTRIGLPAPALNAVALADYPPIGPQDLARGEVTLVNFWASWCPPCHAEHPELLRLEEQGIPIVGVNFRDRAADAQRYLENADNPFIAIAFDPAGRAALDWGVTAPPETFILDGDGTVLFRFQGPLIGSDYANRFVPAFLDAQREQ